jgi:hypothetical protein
MKHTLYINLISSIIKIGINYFLNERKYDNTVL